MRHCFKVLCLLYTLEKEKSFVDRFGLGVVIISISWGKYLFMQIIKISNYKSLLSKIFMVVDYLLMDRSYKLGEYMLLVNHQFCFINILYILVWSQSWYKFIFLIKSLPESHWLWNFKLKPTFELIPVSYGINSWCFL